LFGPLGITGFEWSKMKDGYDDGSGLLSIHLHTADLVKLGALLLNGGSYAGKQVAPQKWVKLIVQPDISYPSYWGFDHSTYALCYYHTTCKGIGITYGMGWGGQFLMMIPQLHAVIAINENIADASAIKQSNDFIYRIFPVIFDELQRGN